MEIKFDRRRLAQLGLIALASQPTFAASKPNAADILRQVSAIYRASTEYEFTLSAGRSHYHAAFRAPDLIRIEGTIPGTAWDPSAVAVFDGTTLRMYRPDTKEFFSLPREGFDGLIEMMTMAQPATIGLLVDRAASSVLLREETLVQKGPAIDCYVIRWVDSDRNSGTWWIDKKHYHVLRLDNTSGSTVLSGIKLGEKLADALFKFDPPPGSTQAVRSP